MPVVRSEGFLSALEPLGTPLYDELTGDYVVFYALDLPDRVQFLSADDLDELAMTHDEVRQHALTNLQFLENPPFGGKGLPRQRAPQRASHLMPPFRAEGTYPIRRT